MSTTTPKGATGTCTGSFVSVLTAPAATRIVIKSAHFLNEHAATAAVLNVNVASKLMIKAQGIAAGGNYPASELVNLVLNAGETLQVQDTGGATVNYSIGYSEVTA